MSSTQHIAITGAARGLGFAMAEQWVPHKRWGQPDNIAQAVQFILENDYFSGRTLEVDAALRI